MVRRECCFVVHAITSFLFVEDEQLNTTSFINDIKIQAKDLRLGEIVGQGKLVDCSAKTSWLVYGLVTNK